MSRFENWKTPYKVKRENLVSLPLTGAACETVEIVDPLWSTTGGHFACACVNPLNENSVGASNLMAGNWKLARKVTVLLKAISLVLWILYFPKKYCPWQNRTFSTRVFTCTFFSSKFSWPFKDFQDSTPKSHVPVWVWFSLSKQCISMVWFPSSWFYLSGRKCIVAMFSCFKTKSEKKLPREVYSLARCLMLNWSRRQAFIYATKTWNQWGVLQFFESFCGNIYETYSIGNEEWIEFETATITSDYVVHNHKLSCRRNECSFFEKTNSNFIFL